MVVPVLLAIGAYLFGAIPTANLLARTVRGVDLRTFGSQAVTSSNAGELMGKGAVSLVGVLDILKAAAPVWAAQALDLGLAQRMAIGLAAMVGHNWSPFLKFEGGRGLTAVIGVLLAAAPRELMLFSFVAVFGVALFRNVPLNLGLAAALLPLWSSLLQEPAPIIWGASIMVLLVVAKRLTGNRLGALPEVGRVRVLLYRLLFDRDTRERARWVRRGEPGRLAGNP